MLMQVLINFSMGLIMALFVSVWFCNWYVKWWFFSDEQKNTYSSHFFYLDYWMSTCIWHVPFCLLLQCELHSIYMNITQQTADFCLWPMGYRENIPTQSADCFILLCNCCMCCICIRNNIPLGSVWCCCGGCLWNGKNGRNEYASWGRSWPWRGKEIYPRGESSSSAKFMGQPTTLSIDAAAEYFPMVYLNASRPFLRNMLCSSYSLQDKNMASIGCDLLHVKLIEWFYKSTEGVVLVISNIWHTTYALHMMRTIWW